MDRSIDFSGLLFRVSFAVYFLLVLVPDSPFFLPETFLILAFIAFLYDFRPDWSCWWDDPVVFWLGGFLLWITLTSLLDGFFLTGGYREWFHFNPALAVPAMVRNLPLRLFAVVFIVYTVMREGTDRDRKGIRLLLWLVYLKLLLIGYADYVSHRGWMTGHHFEAYAHYNLTGSLVNLFIPVVLCELHFSKNTYTTITFLGLFYLGITGTFMTQSRGSIIALIVSLSLFALIYCYRNYARRTLIFTNLMGIAALLLFLYNPSQQFVRERFSQTTFRGMQGIRETGSPVGGLSGRLTRIWPRTLRAISDRPVTGYMLGSYPDVLDRLYGDDRPGSHQHPHNFYLQLLFDGGVVGFLLFLVFSYHFFRRIYAVVQDGGEMVLYALAAGIAGFSEIYVHGLVAMFDYFWLILVLPWLFLADPTVNENRGTSGPEN